MTTKPDDNPAFPQPVAIGPSGDLYLTELPGMTLRDYFAAAALTGALGKSGWDRHGNIGFDPEWFSALAYRIADAMLAERDKE